MSIALTFYENHNIILNVVSYKELKTIYMNIKQIQNKVWKLFMGSFPMKTAKI